MIAEYAQFSETDLDRFVLQQQNQDLLRFITCGNVDDGKSTLIGRILWESQQLFDDQLVTLKNDSLKYGTQGQDIDFALLVDGLTAEREQGITIDVAYRFFATAQRKFIVADTPGHEQYTRNMITGASTADVAVLLMNASQGLQLQTRRHAYLSALMGIRHLLLVVNKMDLVHYDETVFNTLTQEFKYFITTFNFASVTAIPISALKGDNISCPSKFTSWYHGLTVMDYLDSIKLEKNEYSNRLVFPIQWVNRPNATFRGYAGTIAEGSIRVGDKICIVGSDHDAKIASIVTMDANLAVAHQGQAVTLTLDKEIAASRGDIISLAKKPLILTAQFEATLVWLHEDAGFVGRNYQIKLSVQWATATITSIKYKIDVNTLNKISAKQMKLNDILICNIALNKPIVVDSYVNSKTLGGFILIDPFSQATIAAGMITHGLRRADNIRQQVLSITRKEREKLNAHPGNVLWFTGLSGSGKSTLANALEIELHAQGQRTYILDGDNIRLGLNRDLGFTDAERVENIRRVAEVAKLMLDAGLTVLVTFISPFRHEREMARALIEPINFIEIYLNAPLEICEMRDAKGLYTKARAGQLPNMSGIDSPYEPPENPTLVVNYEQSKEESVKAIMKLLKQTDR